MGGYMENEERAGIEKTPIDVEEEPPIVVPPQWEREAPSIPAMPSQYDVAPGYDPQNYSVPQSPPPVYTPLPYAPMQNRIGRPVKAPFHRNCLIAGMLGLFLGGLGTHRFYLGYYKVGVVMLVPGLLTPVLAWMHIPPLVLL